MDRQDIIERLEELQDHCQGMIDDGGPAGIWWGGTEAFTKAVKALSLNIDKNQRRYKIMNQTKVTITYGDNCQKELSGDTVICFTVSGANEFLKDDKQPVNSCTAFVGKAIPGPIRHLVIGTLISEMVVNTNSEKARTAYELHNIAGVLEKESREIRSGLTNREIKECLSQALENLFENTFGR